MTRKQPRVSEQPESAGRAGEGRIVVGVDGSLGSLVALRGALSEPSLRGVDVHAVGAWESPGGMGYAISGNVASPEEALTTAMEATIAAAIAPAPGGGTPAAVSVTASAIYGDPAKELQRAAGDDDLLLVGSRGHGAAVGLLLGSVSQRAVARARCPVVVVPDLVHREEGAAA